MWTAFTEFGFAQLDTSGLQGIDDVEQLPLPADELGARLSAAAIVLGHVAYGGEVLRRHREVAWLALATIGEDGALVQCAAAATAVRLATFAAEGVERASQQWFASETGFEQAGEKLLRLAQLGAKRAKTMVHGVTRGYLYIDIYINLQSWPKFRENRKKGKKGDPGNQGVSRVSRAALSA